MNYPDAFIQYCAALTLKWTSLRKEVLYILWQAKKPLKAYEILDYLLKIKPNSKPPTVYRALLFFVTHGVVHKIESIQCYTLCKEPDKRLFSEILMVCNHCHQTIEVSDPSIWELVQKLAHQHYFKSTQDIIELKGVCSLCSVKILHP